jgi:hypothetical protein
LSFIWRGKPLISLPLSSSPSHIDARPERAVRTKSRRTLGSRHTPPPTLATANPQGLASRSQYQSNTRFPSSPPRLAILTQPKATNPEWNVLYLRHIIPRSRQIPPGRRLRQGTRLRQTSTRLGIYLAPPTRVYTADRDMVCRLRVRHCRIQQTCQTAQIRHRLHPKVSLSFSSRRTHTTEPAINTRRYLSGINSLRAIHPLVAYSLGRSRYANWCILTRRMTSRLALSPSPTTDNEIDDAP